ncbi:collagen alpha-1(I) chain-like [Cricetulus griseus]|uniref:Collagen alpha-1(I) chain-like n=1 Tax=Cricetulus griseus TaxID=10029 RepID=A0A9J7G957_CRIGR|nr:collagen alpha-1(I) chain-like [Cricetulus griseus]
MISSPQVQPEAPQHTVRRHCAGRRGGEAARRGAGGRQARCQPSPGRTAGAAAPRHVVVAAAGSRAPAQLERPGAAGEEEAEETRGGGGGGGGGAGRGAERRAVPGGGAPGLVRGGSRRRGALRLRAGARGSRECGPAGEGGRGRGRGGARRARGGWGRGRPGPGAQARGGALRPGAERGGVRSRRPQPTARRPPARSVARPGPGPAAVGEGEGAARSRPPRREGRQFLSADPEGFGEQLFKGPREGPGRSPHPLPGRLRGRSARGPRMRRQAAWGSRQGCVGTRSPRVGGGPRSRAGVEGVCDERRRSRGRGWSGQERVKGGASPTNKRTCSLLRPATRVCLSGPWPSLGEGAGACTVGTRASGPSPLAEAHTRSSARTHLGHSHSASRDTRPERAHPAHTLTHACSHARTLPLAASELRAADPRPPPRQGAH